MMLCNRELVMRVSTLQNVVTDDTIDIDIQSILNVQKKK